RLPTNQLTPTQAAHTRLRSIVDEAFRRRAVLEMQPHIRVIANDLADRLFEKASPADLVANYAQLLPLAGLTAPLGPPRAGRPAFIGWANSFSRVNGVVGFLSVMPAFARMRRYME